MTQRAIKVYEVTSACPQTEGPFFPYKYQAERYIADLDRRQIHAVIAEFVVFCTKEDLCDALNSLVAGNK